MKIQFGRLIESLPHYIHPLIHTLLDTDYRVYFVGGIPRDILLNKSPKDVDLTTGQGFHAIRKLIETIYGVEKKMETRFLTANYILKNGHIINIAHLRKEKYPKPAQLPLVEPTYSVDVDARRRDFTINSIYIDIYNLSFIDPLNGIKDLKEGILRITYRGSFKDDPTRIFRAIRYKTRMRLKFSEETLAEIKTGKNYIKLLSKERIINELKKIAEEERRIEAIKELSRYSILEIKVKEEILRPLQKIDKLAPFEKNMWIFFFYPLLKEKIVTWPLTRKERNIINFLITPNIPSRNLKFNNQVQQILNILKHASNP